MKKRLSVLLLALVMVISSAAGVMAAPTDFVHTETGSSYSLLQAASSPSVVLKLASSPSAYRVLDTNGNAYSLKEVLDLIATGLSYDEALLEADPVEEELEVIEVSAINANTISVTFEGMEPVEVTLEKALVHGQTEVTFVYEEVEYTATLTEAYVDPAVEAEEALAAAKTAAEEAIAALPTVEEVAIGDAQAVADAKALVEAVKALDAEAVVEGEEVIAELEAKIEELKAEQDAEEALAAATEAVVLAEESELQADVDAATALVNALPEGEDKDALVARLAVVQEAIDERVAAEEALAEATDAVVVAEESLLEADLADAQELVDALEASDAKTLLNARLDSVGLKIANIITAVNNAQIAGNQVALFKLLEKAPFVNADADMIGAYIGTLTGAETTIADIQAVIDAQNLAPETAATIVLVNAAVTAVADAVATPDGDVTPAVTPAVSLIEFAQKSIDKLPETISDAVITGVAPTVVTATVKADLQAELDEVKVVAPVLKAGTNQIKLLAALQNPAFSRVNPDFITTYEGNLTAETTLTNKNTVAKIQGIIDAANLLEAQTAVTTAETAALTTAKVATAQALVDNVKADTDVEKAAVKLLQDRLDMVTALIAVADAKTEAELLTALESEVLALTDVNPEAIADYKTLVNGTTTPLVAPAVIVTKANVQDNVVTAGNAVALNKVLAAVALIDTDTTEADVLVLLESSVLDLDNVDVDLVSEYKALIISPVDVTSAVNIQTNVINAANAADGVIARLAAVNAATTPAEMRTALTAVAINESPINAYVNLTSQEKLEVAELVLVARANETDEEFANTTAVTTAISTATLARSTFLTNVNAATSISTMVTALDVVEFPEFQDLGDLEQVEVAELVLNALNELKAEKPAAEFETIAEVRAAAGL